MNDDFGPLAIVQVVTTRKPTKPGKRRYGFAALAKKPKPKRKGKR